MGKKTKKKISTWKNQKSRQEKNPVRAKKFLGQHFLKDEDIAQQIAETLRFNGYSHVIEIGPGTGVLTTNIMKYCRVKVRSKLSKPIF